MEIGIGIGLMLHRLNTNIILGPNIGPELLGQSPIPPTVIKYHLAIQDKSKNQENLKMQKNLNLRFFNF